MSAHFHRIFGPDRETLFRHGWRTHDYTVRQASRYFRAHRRGRHRPENPVRRRPIPFHAAVGRCCLRYEAVLEERGALVSRLQVKADTLLRDDSIAHQRRRPRQAPDGGRVLGPLPVYRNGSCSVWVESTATFAWWATTTRASTAFAARPSATCWSSRSGFLMPRYAI